MTAAELKELDDKRREREEELLLLLLLLLGWAVGQSLADDGAAGTTALVQPGSNGQPPAGTIQRVPAGVTGQRQGTTAPTTGNRLANGTLTALRRILTTFGVPEIAGSMADAHLDAFKVYEPSLNRAPDRETLIRDYSQAATEMVNAILEAIQQAGGSTLAESLLLAKYSRSDSTGLELGAERQIVTASNAGLLNGAIVRHGRGGITGLRHVSVIDDGTTKICTDRDGLALPVLDTYWLLNYPSLHWRCRSTVVPIVGRFKASNWRPRTPPDVGFGRMPTAVRKMLRSLAA
jgi:SPP1 gp7 family putative phage head morphogenesis protein